MPAILELKNVGKRYPGGMFSSGNVAVKSVSLHVHPGEVYGLIGPNGAGKTTTIKMIAGLLHATRGTISVGGYDTRKASTKAKSLIGYVPDNPDAYDYLTGREFMQLVGALYGMRPEARDDGIARLSRRFGLDKELDAYYGSYSRGTKQKVALLAALLHAPKVLLIDEPMVGLDPTSIAAATELLREFATGGGAVLLSTHTLNVAERLCHRIGVMRRGEIIAEDRPSQLKESAGVRRGGLAEAYARIIGRV